METTSFTFKGKGVHYWRARTERLTSFSDVVSWFQREHGLGKGRAIIAARRSRPEAYNEWMAKKHPNVNRMAQSASKVQSFSMPRGFRVVGV